MNQATRLISDVYAAATRPAEWDRVVQGLASALDASWAVLLSRDDLSSPPRVLGASDQYWSLSEDAGAEIRSPRPGNALDEQAQSEFLDGSAARPAIEVIRSGGAQGGRRCMLLWAMHSPNDCMAFKVGVGRSQGERPFSEAELGFFGDIADHIMRSLALQSRLQRAEARERLWRQAVDKLNVAICLLDAAGTPIETNKAARRLLEDRTCLRLKRGKLTLFGGEKTLDLTPHIEGLFQASSTGKCVVMAPQGRADRCDGLLIALARLGDPAGPDSQRCVAAFIGLPDQEQAGLTDMIQQVFHMTPMEARTAVAMMRGTGAGAAAKQLGVGVETIRTQMKRVFAKTGTAKQSQFIQRILGTGVTLVS